MRLYRLKLYSQRQRLIVVALVVLTLAALSVASGAHAAEPSGSHWLVAPYLWAPNIKGLVGFGGTEIPLDVSARDLAGGVKGGAMGYAAWNYRQHFVYAEGLGFAFREHQFAPVRDLDIDAKLVVGELGYGQQVAVPLGARRLWLSPYLGLRYSRLVATAATPQGSLIQRSMHADDQWVSPAIGVIAELPLFSKLTSTVKLDAAGLGIGHDHYWNSIAVLRWYFTPGLSIGLGYRIAKFDADPGGSNQLSLRLRGSGPEGGLAYSF